MRILLLLLWGTLGHLSSSVQSFRFSSTSSRFLTTAFPTQSSSSSSALSSSSTSGFCSSPHPSTAHKLYSSPRSTLFSYNQSSVMVQEQEEPQQQEQQQQETHVMNFPDELIENDTYNGITLRLDYIANHFENATTSYSTVVAPDSFRTRLKESLHLWKEQGRKGIWMYVPNSLADLVPIATSLGFRFHMVNHDGQLILSHWLPIDVPSRLPRGPMYQVGVGCLVLKPNDPTQMLVVKELTGPAAALDLWKMPTGLADPSEDIHQAAVRELQEETGLAAICEGILVFRQSHATRSGTRAASDLFFVCRMKLVLPEPHVDHKDGGGDDDENNINTIVENLVLTAQPEEIAGIRWMPIQEYCDQKAWQRSPVYHELNRACFATGTADLFAPATFPLNSQDITGATNTLYYKSSQLTVLR